MGFPIQVRQHLYIESGQIIKYTTYLTLTSEIWRYWNYSRQNWVKSLCCLKVEGPQCKQYGFIEYGEDDSSICSPTGSLNSREGHHYRPLGRSNPLISNIQLDLIRAQANLGAQRDVWRLISPWARQGKAWHHHLAHWGLDKMVAVLRKIFQLPLIGSGESTDLLWWNKKNN